MADIHVDQLTTQNFYQIPQIFFTELKKLTIKKENCDLKRNILAVMQECLMMQK